MKSNHGGNDRGHVTETPDVSHIRNVDVAHELDDVEIRGILTFLVGLMVLTIVVYFLMLFMFKVLNSREESKPEERLSPMAMSEKERLPPEPRLQGARGFGEQLGKEIGAAQSPEELKKPKDPLFEIDALRGYWTRILTTGKDPTGKTVALPIEDAKLLALTNGSLAARETKLPEGGPGSRAEDYGVDMPTASSSGRMTEKRKQ
jgi:hypothetical protein